MIIKIEAIETLTMAIDLGLTELYQKDCLQMFLHLENWFIKYPQGFPKHCEPRRDQEKLDGLSWTEELPLNRYFVKKNFRKIGVHYKSRKEYEQATDKFQGKYYCSVYDASNYKRTFYYRDNNLFDELRKRWLKQLKEGLALAE